MGDILVVDDEQSMREFLDICLSRAGHDVRVAASGTEALSQIDVRVPDVVVTDLRMPGDIDGLGLLHEVKRRGYPTEVLVVTAFASPETAIAAMKDGAYDYLTKPFKVDEIGAVIGRALERRALVTANEALREQVAGRYKLGSLLGQSEAMQKVFDLVRKVAATSTSILITGESGTGKELVARAIHSESERADAPFVAVNCGAIPSELMESELFGHEKGAFTGAVSSKDGLFRGADGGTLFLDEIGELSLNLQVKLLRALQERKVKAVGAENEVSFDVRIVAATNRDLEEEVSVGAFRQDLYYRLNVIEVRLPPLRQRQDDIPLLVSHFVRRFCGEQGTTPKTVTKEAMARLQNYDYPGNVRELENIVERVVTLESAAEISPDSLPSLTVRRQPRPTGQMDFPIDIDRVMSDFERQLVEKALEEANGVRKRAAELLGITMRSFRYRLSKLAIEPNDE